MGVGKSQGEGWTSEGDLNGEERDSEETMHRLPRISQLWQQRSPDLSKSLLWDSTGSVEGGRREGGALGCGHREGREMGWGLKGGRGERRP